MENPQDEQQMRMTSIRNHYSSKVKRTIEVKDANVNCQLGCVAAKIQKNVDFELVTIIPLCDAILCSIVERYIPCYMWHNVEKVSKQFQRIIALVYRSLKVFDVRHFLPAIHRSKNPTESQHRPKLVQILAKISKYCFSLENIDGLLCTQPNLGPTLWKNDFKILSKFSQTLQSLNLTKCNFNIEVFAGFLRSVENLRSLNLTRCTFEFDLIHKLVLIERLLAESFAQLDKLESLSLTNIDKLEGSFLKGINTESLKSLSLNDVEFSTSSIRDFVQSCVKLKCLYLSFVFTTRDGISRNGCGIDISLIPCLANLCLLESLKLESSGIRLLHWQSPIHLDLAPAFSKMKNLRELWLSPNVAPPTISAIVQSCPALETFSFITQNEPLQCFSDLVHLGKLKHLHVNLTSMENGRDILELSSKIRSIESLSFVPVCYATLDTIGLFHGLRRIEVDGESITDKILISWCKKFGEQLVELEIPGCFQITDVAISVLATCCTNIRVLNIDKAGVRNQSAFDLAENCHQLEILHLCQCDLVESFNMVTVNGFLWILDHCPKLKQLYVNYSFGRSLLKSPDYVRHKYRVCIN